MVTTDRGVQQNKSIEKEMDPVLFEIVSWLDNTNKFRVRRVSKLWNRVVLGSFRFAFHKRNREKGNQLV
jgi:hypothetical protein